MEGRTESFLCKQKNRKVNKYSKRERKRYNGEKGEQRYQREGEGKRELTDTFILRGKLMGANRMRKGTKNL